MTQQRISVAEIRSALTTAGLPAEPIDVRSAIDTLALRGYSQAAAKRYGAPLVVDDGDSIRLTDSVRDSLAESMAFRAAVRDLLDTGQALTQRRYLRDRPFTPGMQYTRADAAHLLGWPRAVSSTIYGVRTDPVLGVCAIFVTLEKAEDVSASTAYRDRLVDPSTMRWFTKSNRTMTSRDVAPILSGAIDIHVFVKKDDAEGSDHYYLGQAAARDPEETTMPGAAGEPLPVVSMLLRFDRPMTQGLFDYFDPGTDEPMTSPR